MFDQITFNGEDVSHIWTFLKIHNIKIKHQNNNITILNILELNIELKTERKRKMCALSLCIECTLETLWRWRLNTTYRAKSLRIWKAVGGTLEMEETIISFTIDYWGMSTGKHMILVVYLDSKSLTYLLFADVTLEFRELILHVSHIETGVWQKIFSFLFNLLKITERTGSRHNTIHNVYLNSIHCMFGT